MPRSCTVSLAVQSAMAVLLLFPFVPVKAAVLKNFDTSPKNSK